jgi:hypothetical protein
VAKIFSFEKLRRSLSGRLPLQTPLEKERLKDVTSDMSYDRNRDSVTYQMIGIVIVLRKNILFGKAHKSSGFSR